MPTELCARFCTGNSSACTAESSPLFLIPAVFSLTLRVVRRSVTLRNERHNDLRIPAGSQRSGLQKRFIEANAAGIDVFPRLHVVQRVADERQSLEKRVGEAILRLGTHFRLEKLATHRRIH